MEGMSSNERIVFRYEVKTKIIFKKSAPALNMEFQISLHFMQFTTKAI
jgi:hypothetical protein